MNKPRHVSRRVLTTLGVLCLASALRAEMPDDVKSAIQATSATLKGAEKIELTAKRTLSPAFAEASSQFPEARITVTALRPSRFKASSSAGEGEARVFYFDGKNVTLFDSNSGLYAEAGLEGTIDDMIDAIEAKFGFSPPVVDLFYSQLGEAVLEGGDWNGEMLGKEGGTVHLKLSDEAVSWEAWIGEDDHLPKKLQIVFLDQEGKPSITVEDMKWNLAAELSEDDFAFKAPDGATKAEMMTTEQIDSELKK
ncbi:MAG: DUF2092 domain-containing protein [Verrucomicrobiae bacterium]|nr:DUF2092 domain-containing protein [Verrucomicrobiae bacterium]